AVLAEALLAPRSAAVVGRAGHADETRQRLAVAETTRKDFVNQRRGRLHPDADEADQELDHALDAVGIGDGDDLLAGRLDLSQLPGQEPMLRHQALEARPRVR